MKEKKIITAELLAGTGTFIEVPAFSFTGSRTLRLASPG